MTLYLCCKRTFILSSGRPCSAQIPKKVSKTWNLVQDLNSSIFKKKYSIHPIKVKNSIHFHRENPVNPPLCTKLNETFDRIKFPPLITATNFEPLSLSLSLCLSTRSIRFRLRCNLTFIHYSSEHGLSHVCLDVLSILWHAQNNCTQKKVKRHGSSSLSSLLFSPSHPSRARHHWEDRNFMTGRRADEY